MSFLPMLVVSPSSSNLKQSILNFLVKENVLPTDTNLENYADLHFVNAEDESLKIEDVRRFTAELSLKPYQADTSIFVLFHLDHASIPAQNALLKSLEEPPSFARIFLSVEKLDKVLPTIQSRCTVVTLEGEKTDDGSESAEVADEYHTMCYGKVGELFALSEKYKERDEAVRFLQRLAHFLHQKNAETPSASISSQLYSLLKTIDFLEKNVNVRLALENYFFEVRKK